MNSTNISFDQVVPISQVRNNLAGLISNLKDDDYMLVSQKYRSKAALVSLPLFNKLLLVYKKWQREQDFQTLSEIKNSLPTRNYSQIRKDVDRAVQEVRKF